MAIISKGSIRGRNWCDQLLPVSEPKLLSGVLKNLYSLVCRQLISTFILLTCLPCMPPSQCHLCCVSRAQPLTLSENVSPVPTSKPCVLHLSLLGMSFPVCCLLACWNLLLSELVVLPHVWGLSRGHTPLSFCGALYPSLVPHFHVVV